MTSGSKTTGETTEETYALMEKAQRRIKQKKRLYYHFVFFLVGSVFLIIINKVLKVKEEWGDWFVWAIILWAFLLAIHAFNVYVTQKFLGKEWEQKQREKLIEKQRNRIAEIEQEVKAAFPPPRQQKDTPNA